MKVLHGWLKEYVGEAMPPAEDVERLLTFHSFEIDGVETEGDHTVIDVDVLPSRSSDCLCHRGVAHEIAALLGEKLVHDPFAQEPVLEPEATELKITIAPDAACPRFASALMEGVSIKKSPDWLRERLEALGQRSINNVVDATNYVMLSVGQPLHAYDAKKVTQSGDGWHMGVRMARAGERITTLTGEVYELTPDNQVIVDMHSDTLLGLAGVKGGKHAEIDEGTTSIIIEAANFDPKTTRKTAQALKLQTDASKRFENAVSPNIVPYALKEITELIADVAGGTVLGYVDLYNKPTENSVVPVKRMQMNALLGLTLPTGVVEDILNRLNFSFETTPDGWNVVAPHERTDINIPEDVIEEVGRMYGYEHITSVIPEKVVLSELNLRHFYSEKIRKALTALGFSEVITSSFRKKDEIRLLNALASDKEYLRSSLKKNIAEVLEKNIPNADLLGLRDIRVFEIGTVFKKGDTETGIDEAYLVALGARTKQQGYNPKDDTILEEAIKNLEDTLGVSIQHEKGNGVIEFSLSKLLSELPQPTDYDPYTGKKDMQFKPFSTYPFVTRDIALWTPAETKATDVEEVLNSAAGKLRVRTTLFDEFKKDDRVSYAFRLVFQSENKTLTDAEVNDIMAGVTAAVERQDFEVR